jgi:hypothetical protein
MNEENLAAKIVNMTLPEAIGEILRKGFDFRIVLEDNLPFYSEGDLDPNRINLSIENRRIINATVG